MKYDFDVISVTLVRTKGSAPQEIGAKMVIGPDGRQGGTVGGGKVEERVIAHSKELLSKAQSHDFQEWNLQTDIKMTCGGVVSFYFEKIKASPEWSIAIFGAGHVAQEVVRQLIKLECEVICSDPRLEWLERLPEALNLKKIHTENMASVVATLKPGTFIASMTMGHAFDLPVLLEAFKRSDIPYLGVIGSDSKAVVFRNDLLKNAIPEEKVNTLHCPIGEKFGNNTPVEIAFSIVAQLIRTRDSLKLMK